MALPLELIRATKFYGEKTAPVAALQDVSLSIDRGEFVALVGRSGCGKSTLLNLSGAMDFPTSGSVLIDGLKTSNLSDAGLTQLRRTKVGFIFQSFQLLHTLSAVENVELPLLLARKPNARHTARERLQWVELAELEDRFPHQLSGGQQQRVAIARALASDPLLLLADEPTGNLDSATGEVVLQLLSRSAREFGITIVMATHGSEGIAAVDRIVHMRDGRISQIEDRQFAPRTA